MSSVTFLKICFPSFFFSLRVTKVLTVLDRKSSSNSAITFGIPRALLLGQVFSHCLNNPPEPVIIWNYSIFNSPCFLVRPISKTYLKFKQFTYVETNDERLVFVHIEYSCCKFSLISKVMKQNRQLNQMKKSVSTY